MVRQTANAPGVVGQSGGNSECAKVLLGLEFGQSQGKVKDCAELALKQVWFSACQFSLQLLCTGLIFCRSKTHVIRCTILSSSWLRW